MENSPEFPETHKDNLLGIRNSADDLQRIISDVLDLSKLESGSMSLEAVSCNIRTIAEGALESAASSAHSKGLELVLLNSLDTDPPHQIISDPFRLRQCIIGLVGNSLKFTALGRISLTYSIEPAPSGGLILKFAVEDTGIGIAKESFDKLFKPFSQVDASINRRHGGSGLGLSIIANLARLLGGAAWCEKSAVGQGSTFCFSATVYADPDSTIIPPRRAVPASALVVAQSTETTAAMLRNLDVMAVRAITCAPGSLEAYEDMDFVLLDNNLGPSGLTAVQEYTAKRPKVKVVYLTELVDRASFQHKVADTSAKIITKPIKSSALFEAVDDAPKGQGEKGKKRRPNTATTIDKDTAERYPLSILFVDDNPINRSVGTKILAKFGYKILDTAQDGAEAVAATEKKDYDIVFLDLQMPVMDGHTALKKILESKSEEDVPYIVALTANADLNTRKKCLADGFHSFLSKPLIIRELDAVFKAAYQAKHGAGSVGTPMAGSPSL